MNEWKEISSLKGSTEVKTRPISAGVRVPLATSAAQMQMWTGREIK